MMVSVIVPSLNEERHLPSLIESVYAQKYPHFEMIVVDGGSIDRTVSFAEAAGATVIVQPGLEEFASRNIAVEHSKGEILLFTCAKAIFPSSLLETVVTEFSFRKNAVAIFGPHVPYNGPRWVRREYRLYNYARYIMSKIGIVSTGTNFFAIRRSAWDCAGPFLTDDVNADGEYGRRLQNHGAVVFLPHTHVSISTMRAQRFGFMLFHLQYLYVLENFIVPLRMVMKPLKRKARMIHRSLREPTREQVFGQTLQMQCEKRTEPSAISAE